MKLDNYSRKDILIIGFFLGVSFCGLVFKFVLDSSQAKFQVIIDDVYENKDMGVALEAQLLLYLAEILRDKKHDEALNVIEEVVQIKVESFTDKGRKLKRMTKKEAEVLNLVKKYRETYCSAECFEEILYILER
ncbi:hypothetical protein [Colwellia piezophila]|uniref:hypothetical protein n=1 Tax=Colwellia piezophila TaxID=211668 RepID=UPI00036A70E5|nr:hypothetical protein [Colwellia piezophila]